MNAGRKFSPLKIPVRISFGLFYPFILLAILYVMAFLYGNSRHLNTLIEDLVSGAVPGGLEMTEIQMDPRIFSVKVYGTNLTHPDGEVIISARETSATLDVTELLHGNITLSRIEIVEPDVLISFDDKGEFRLLEVFDDPRELDPRLPVSHVPTLRFLGISLEGGDVLIHNPEFGLLFEDVQIRRCRVTLVNDVVTVAGDVYIPSGRGIFLPELFELADPRETFTLREYRTARRQDPWGAMKSDLVGRYGEDYGVLDVDFSRISADRYVLVDDMMRVGEFRMDLAGGSAQGAGWMIVDPPPKEDDFRFATRADLSLPPDSSIFSYFLEDAMKPAADSAEIGGHFEVAGSTSEIGGRIDLSIRDTLIADLPIDRLELAIRTAFGTPFTVPPGGLEATIDAGTVTGHGVFDPADGVYELALWIAQLPSELFGGLLPDGVDPNALVGFFDTDPPAPEDGRGAPIILSGDLDGKTFPDLAETRASRVGSDLLGARIDALDWTSTGGDDAPFRSAHLEGLVRLGADGRVRLSGVDDEPDLLLRLAPDEFRARGAVDIVTERFEGLRVWGSAESLQRFVDLGDLDARLQAAVVLNGPLSEPRIDVDRLDLSHFAAEMLRVGSITTSVGIDNTGDVPVLEGGHVAMRDVFFEGFEASEVEADYSFDGDWVNIRDGRVDADIGVVEVAGRAQVFESGRRLDDPRLDLQIRANSLDLSVLLPGEPVEGSLELQADVSGSAERPRVSGHFVLRDAGVFDESIDEASGDVRYGPEGVSVTNIEVVSEGAVATGEVHLGHDLELRSGRVHVDGLALEQLHTLQDMGLDVRGVVDLRVSLTHSDDVSIQPGLEDIYPATGLPDVEGTLIVRGLGIGEHDYGSIAFTADTYGEEVRAVGQLARHFDTEMIIPLVANRPIELHSRFDRVPLVDLLPNLEPILSGGEANRGEVALTYDVESGGIHSTISIGELWLQARGRRFATGGPVNLTYEAAEDLATGETERRLLIPDLRFGTNGRYLAIDGSITNFSDLDLAVHGEAELSLFALVTDAIAEASGLAHLDLIVGGTLDSPSPGGAVVFEDAEFTIRDLGDNILVDEGVILLEPEPDGVLTLRVPRRDAIRGRVFDGAFTLDGAVRMESFSPQSLELSLDAHNLSYRVPDELLVTLNRADLYLFAIGLDEEEPEFYLSGNVFIEEGLYFKDLGDFGGAVRSAVVGLFEREVELYEDPIWEQSPLLGLMQFDLNIQASDGVFVRNEMYGAEVEAEMQANLQLRGSLAQPELTGDVEILEGEVTFQNRVFNVRNCTLLFQTRTTDVGVPLPYVDSCVAEATIERTVPRRGRRSGTDEAGETLTETTEERPEPYIIQVTAEGYLDDVELQFASVNYPLVQADIVSLIFLGVTVDEVGTRAAGEPSLDILVRQLVSLLEAPLEENLPFDTLSVSPTVSGATTFHFTRQINDRLYLTGETTVFGAEEDGQRATLQYTATDSIILELSEQSESGGNTEANGRIRFRFRLD